MDPLAASVELARRTRSVVLCGGAETLAVQPDGESYRITEGGPGLGTSGSGDVQAGLVTGLLARGADPLQAAVWGGYLHGAAGDRLAQHVGAWVPGPGDRRCRPGSADLARGLTLRRPVAPVEGSFRAHAPGAARAGLAARQVGDTGPGGGQPQPLVGGVEVERWVCMIMPRAMSTSRCASIRSGACAAASRVVKSRSALCTAWVAEPPTASAIRSVHPSNASGVEP